MASSWQVMMESQEKDDFFMYSICFFYIWRVADIYVCDIQYINCICIYHMYMIHLFDLIQFQFQ